jgi:hypothetical protein
MSANGHSSAAQIRSRLAHLVIDAGGHWLEFAPVCVEQLRKVSSDRSFSCQLPTAPGSPRSAPGKRL